MEGEQSADESTRRARLRWFETVFVLVLATEYWCRAIPRWDMLGAHYTASLALVPLAGALTFVPRLRGAAFLGLALNHAVVIWNEFPSTGNHAYLELIFCLFAALLDPRFAREAKLYEVSIRWVTAVVFFHSGLQKLVHGYYLHGQYLAYSLSTEAFRPVLRTLLSAAEYDRLIALPHEVGAGPFLVESAALLAASNAIWVIELLLAPLLVWRRTRTAAAVLGIVVLVAIEIGAREVFFAMVFANAVLLCFAAPAHRRAAPAFVLLCLYLIAARAGWLPAANFH